MIPPLAFAFLAAILWASADIFSKKAVEKVNPVLAVFWARLFGILPFAALFLLAPQPFPFEHVWVIAGIALLVALGFLFFFKGLEFERVSLIQPLVYTDGAIAAMIAILFFGEAVTLLSAVGLGLTVVGVFFATVSLKAVRDKKVLFSKSTLYGMVSGACLGLSLVGAKFLSNEFDAVSAIVFYGIFGLAFLFAYLVVTKQFKLVPVSSVKFLLPSGILDTSAFAVFYVALAVLPSSIVSPIATTGSVVALVILSKFFLKEKLSLQEKMGVALIIVAIFLLSMQAVG